MFFRSRASLVVLPVVLETWVQCLGWEEPLEKEKATHSGILVWKIQWTEEPGRLWSLGLQRVRHGLATKPPSPPLGLNLRNLSVLPEGSHHFPNFTPWLSREYQVGINQGGKKESQEDPPLALG